MADKAPGLILLTSTSGGLLRDAVSALSSGGAAPPCIAHTLDSVMTAAGDVLVSFGTSVIVPRDVLARFTGRAFNVHAASPDYPGRDPHHFAVYDRVRRYGATLHLMTERVDEGDILDVEWFDVPPGCSPAALLDLANKASVRLLRRHASTLARGVVEPSGTAPRWGVPKRSRADFLAMCALDPGIDAEEFERRFRAFDGGAYDNLTVKLHGRTFRIDKNAGRGLAQARGRGADGDGADGPG